MVVTKLSRDGCGGCITRTMDDVSSITAVHIFIYSSMFNTAQHNSAPERIGGANTICCNPAALYCRHNGKSSCFSITVFDPEVGSAPILILSLSLFSLVCPRLHPPINQCSHKSLCPQTSRRSTSHDFPPSETSAGSAVLLQ